MSVFFARNSPLFLLSTKGCALCIFAPKNQIRILAYRLTINKWFTRGILVAIVINTIFMGMADYSAVTDDYTLDTSGSWRNNLIKVTDRGSCILGAVRGRNVWKNDSLWSRLQWE